MCLIARTHTVATCNETGDPQPNPVSSIVIRTDSGQTGSTGAVDTFTYTCASGYSVVGNATVTFECTGDAGGGSSWKGTPPTCSAAACNETGDPQPNTLSTAVVRTDSGQSGDTGGHANFTYSCNPGYALVGGPSVPFTCTGDSLGVSTWKGTPPTCSAAACNEATDPQPNNLTANVIRTDSGQTGSTGGHANFTYSCNPGYSLAADSLATLDEHLSKCLAAAPADTRKTIAVQAATSSSNTISTLLDELEAEVTASVGSGGTTAASAGSTLQSLNVVMAPPATKPPLADRVRASDTALKILQAVDSIADNLAVALPVGETSIVRPAGATISIAVKVSPPDATVMEIQSDSASVRLQVADQARLEAIPTTGEYYSVGEFYQGSNQAIRQSLKPDARRPDSGGARTLSVMESISSPAPYAGVRTRESGFVLSGFSPFIRMTAKQNNNLMGGIRTRLVNPSDSGRVGTDTRSNRRLHSERTQIDEEGQAGEVSESWDSQFESESLSQEDRKLTTTDEDRNQNIVRIQLSEPEKEKLLKQRSLVENDWTTYGLGGAGGGWEVECSQLDVQNEEWTYDGCTTIEGDEVQCEYVIRALDAVFIFQQRSGSRGGSASSGPSPSSFAHGDFRL
uniref:Sushi domain-containing protein n=1 Tax=Chromera velia CCMP2878 TaxID=1169474 RepID=A0A0G4HMP8_9ALVE|eukprot:Cvel_1194.t1-p1 / transcript=Cvel_1194.t1 / gene=Cvel_1194 / organism=Chromera_velia_CCMP2878 / gene_product=Sushi, von Willebrand factor type A, EGF and, putative / transcript_product=Sushi, von Willebrand factor type A, EGF and, putative / location=Cvel_scaffold39:148846-157583(-) / protein_length=625 / sequence_SO=supercontig / SO=protein_coding / is_pseudo=false